MRSITTFLILCFSFVLSACGTVEPQVLYRTIVVAIPKSQLPKCEVEPPPDQKQYLAADAQGKEVMLSKTLSKQYKKTDECNIRIEKALKWSDEQEAMHKAKNDEKK